MSATDTTRQDSNRFARRVNAHHSILCTEWCKIVPAKFWLKSQNFPKLADWAVLGWSSFLAALGAGIFKHAGLILHTSVEEDFKHRVTTKNSTPMVAVRSTIIELIARDDVVSMSKMAAIIDFRVHIK